MSVLIRHVRGFFGQNSTPPRLEDILRQIDALEVQKRILERETKIGADHTERLAEIETQIAAAIQERDILKKQWEKEKTLTEKIRGLQESLESPEKKNSEASAKESEITGRTRTA